MDLGPKSTKRSEAKESHFKHLKLWIPWGTEGLWVFLPLLMYGSKGNSLEPLKCLSRPQLRARSCKQGLYHSGTDWARVLFAVYQWATSKGLSICCEVKCSGFVNLNRMGLSHPFFCPAFLLMMFSCACIKEHNTTPKTVPFRKQNSSGEGSERKNVKEGPNCIGNCNRSHTLPLVSRVPRYRALRTVSNDKKQTVKERKNKVADAILQWLQWGKVWSMVLSQVKHNSPWLTGWNSRRINGGKGSKEKKPKKKQ